MHLVARDPLALGGNGLGLDSGDGGGILGALFADQALAVVTLSLVSRRSKWQRLVKQPLPGFGTHGVTVGQT